MQIPWMKNYRWCYFVYLYPETESSGRILNGNNGATGIATVESETLSTCTIISGAK